MAIRNNLQEDDDDAPAYGSLMPAELSAAQSHGWLAFPTGVMTQDGGES